MTCRKAVRGNLNLRSTVRDNTVFSPCKLGVSKAPHGARENNFNLLIFNFKLQEIELYFTKGSRTTPMIRHDPIIIMDPQIKISSISMTFQDGIGLVLCTQINFLWAGV